MTRQIDFRTAVRYATIVSAFVLCLVPAMGQDGAAKVIFQTGQVSRLVDNNLWALSANDVIQPKQVIVTGVDGYAKFRVSDGSTFEVFPNSKVVFRKNADWKDMVDMLIGRIKVHIQKLGGQPNPNNVHTPIAVISVRGTTFDVVVEDDDTTTVAVDEGLVSVRHTILVSKEVLVNPGEVLRVYPNQPLASRSDKGSIWRFFARKAWDAIQDMPRIGGSGSPGGTTGSPLPGDRTGGKTGNGDSTPPPPPPAPPPPPPSPGSNE